MSDLQTKSNNCTREINSLEKEISQCATEIEQFESGAREAGQSLKDFEDSLQIVCARNNGCRAIISRDKHILEFGIRFPVILSPEEYLRKIAL